MLLNACEKKKWCLAGDPGLIMPMVADSFESVALKASPSLLYNNLSNDGTLIAYTHGSDVHILRENVCSGAAPTHLPKVYRENLPIC